MFESFSAFGFFVQTPCGPRKSGIPESVEIPAPADGKVIYTATGLRVGLFKPDESIA